MTGRIHALPCWIHRDMWISPQKWSGCFRCWTMQVVIINALDGIQSHTETIWKLLQHYHVPALVFVNKMDVSHTERTQIMEDLKRHLDEHCGWMLPCRMKHVRSSWPCAVMNCWKAIWETGGITDEQLADAVAQRTIFPCCFGSALKMEGIQEFLDMLNSCTKARHIRKHLVPGY